MSSSTPLPAGVGYGVVVGVGFFFAFVMCCISYIQVRELLGLYPPLSPSADQYRIDTPSTRQRQVKSSILPAEASNPA